MGKPKLKFIISRKPTKWEKFLKWINEVHEIKIYIPEKIRWWKTQEEKIEILKPELNKMFGDYDYTTQEINIFPTQRTEQEIKKMIAQNTVDYYYKRLLMFKAFNKKMNKMQSDNRRKNENKQIKNYQPIWN